MPKHIVRKYTTAAFFIFLPHKTKGLFLQGKVLYMCYSLLQIESWGKTRANNRFLSCLKVYLYVYLHIYKVGFPGIKVWNILLHFHTYVDEINCD